jgi:hypothetical protein
LNFPILQPFAQPCYSSYNDSLSSKIKEKIVDRLSTSGKGSREKDISTSESDSEGEEEEITLYTPPSPPQPPPIPPVQPPLVPPILPPVLRHYHLLHFLQFQ